jgi:hypothetical protein
MQRPPRPYLRLVTEPQPPSGSPLFVENTTMPTVSLSTDTQLTFTFRGLTVPTVEALCAELHAHRIAGEVGNPHIATFDPENMHYGRPHLVLTAYYEGVGFEDEEVLVTYPWDHTVWSLLEAAETARNHRGAVYVEQDVYGPMDGRDEETIEEGVHLDEGFRVMVADFLPPALRASLDKAASDLKAQMADLMGGDE